MTTGTLPGVNVGGTYSQALAATGGTAPYSWSVSAGALPAGLTLSGVAVIGGTATATGTANFTVQVSNSSATPKTATKELSIAVSAVPAIAIGNVSVTLTASTGGAGFLSTKGSWTVTSSGNPLRITGISWFGFETNNRVLHGLWTRGYMSALDQNKAPDFSTLRIPFSNAMLKPGATTNSINFQVNPDLKDLTPLQVFDKIVGYCGQIGLRVILCRHSAKADGYMGEMCGSSPAMRISPSSGGSRTG
jgi:aryl-phospho-beta-D-glucosidase BglC (GH1 family)